MVENSSIMADQSFFGDRSFSVKESSRAQKDMTKNSSNAEKIYEGYLYLLHFLD